MKLDSSLVMVLPQKFCGVIPLFIGVEIVLAVSILNKAGGAFGIVSLLTGHPINFLQWLYNMSCLVILPFYIGGVSNITTKLKNVRKMSLVCLIYTFDTLFGILYTIYFTYFWFSNEDTSPIEEKRELKDSAYFHGSQSASPARELFLMTSTTLITKGVRVYFNLIIVSFTRSLIKQYNVNGQDLIADDEQDIFQGKSIVHKVRRRLFELEMKSKEILVDFFN